MGVEGPRNDDKRLICLVKDFKHDEHEILNIWYLLWKQIYFDILPSF